MASAISQDLVQDLKKSFEENPKNILAQNVCAKLDPNEVCVKRRIFEKSNHIFSNKVELEGKPVTHQKNSGRCWIFACLNAMRVPFMKHHNLDEFEFSQNYLFFWDKLERCNYFLNNIIETANRGEEADGRLVSFLLSDPCNDGGQWDMLVNLITKYGLMPKKCYPETFSSELSSRVNNILKSKLREYARDLRQVIADKGDVTPKLNGMIKEIYKILGICLSVPPETFSWEYYNKDKSYNNVGPLTPLEFYEKYVKPIYNVENKVCLVHDPRPDHSYGKAYTIDCLGNMIGGKQTFYNNQPIDDLLKYTAESIKNNEAVWFGCDVSKRMGAPKTLSILDPNLHDYKLVFDVEINLGLTKAERLLYGESQMTHAMIFTAISTDANNKVNKLRVENSWGEDTGEKGYLVMTESWFKEFVFEVVIDKKYLPEEVLAVQNQTPVMLPAWDPLGALA